MFMVDQQSLFQREAQPEQRIPRIGALGVSATETAVNQAVGVQEKRGPRQIVVEVEDIEVGAGDAHQTNPHESVGHLGDFFQTNNLLVPLIAIPSGITAKHEKNRLARLPRGGLAPSRFVCQPSCGPRRVAAVCAATGLVNSDPIIRGTSSMGRIDATTAIFSKVPRT